jgi:flagellar basal body P-ring formation protein FlgA
MVLGAIMSTDGTAAGIQDHGAIRAAAEAHAIAATAGLTPAGASVTASVSAIDPRLALAACPAPLDAFSPPGFRPAARISVGVRCPTDPGWSLFVPVRLEIRTDVVVLTAPAGRGDILTRTHLSLEQRDVAQLLDGYLTRLEDAEQMVLRRPLAIGTVLTTQTVAPPTLVKRGQRVQLISAAGTFSVRAEGEALGDAARGERVRARNLRSRQVVEGVVDEQGRLLVGDSA